MLMLMPTIVADTIPRNFDSGQFSSEWATPKELVNTYAECSTVAGSRTWQTRHTLVPQSGWILHTGATRSEITIVGGGGGGIITGCCGMCEPSALLELSFLQVIDGTALRSARQDGIKTQPRVLPGKAGIVLLTYSRESRAFFEARWVRGETATESYLMAAPKAPRATYMSTYNLCLEDARINLAEWPQEFLGDLGQEHGSSLSASANSLSQTSASNCEEAKN
ncbi:hypothetical protein B0H19DRAFT_1084544 [Mycena capillaripes]|nr:hypothetical protein B0H19DRAFT_1084544 [Mycena capillaripes]